MGGTAFLSIEGISSELASDILRNWRSALPPILIGSNNPEKFGDSALGQKTATSVRNSSELGICVVLCQGYTAIDAQSIGQFRQITLTELIRSEKSLAFMATAIEPILDLDGPLRHVKSALLSAQNELLPSATAIALFFDALQEGCTLGGALPLIGGFKDTEGVSQSSFSVTRVLDNLLLARKVLQGDVKDYDAVRARAQLIEFQAQIRTEQLMLDLERGSTDLLSNLTFNEARELFEERSAEFPDLVRLQLDSFKARRPDVQNDPDEQDLFERATANARDIASSSLRREAARFLYDYDLQFTRDIFDDATRKKLSQLSRDSVLVASDDSLEAGIIRACLALEGRCTKIEVSVKSIPPTLESKSAVRQQLTLILATFYVTDLLKDVFESRGVDVHGLLTTSPRHLLQQIGNATFDDLFATAGATADEDFLFAPLFIKITGASRKDSIELKWTPTIDHLANFAAVWNFAERATVRLEIQESPSPQNFCDASSRRSLKPSEAAEGLAIALQAKCSAFLDHGLTSPLLSSWIMEWYSITAKARIEGANIDDFFLTGGIQNAGETVALTIASPLKAEWYLQRLVEFKKLAVSLLARAEATDPDEEASRIEECSAALASISSANAPPFVYRSVTDRPLLPVEETGLWSVFSTAYESNDDSHSEDAIRTVIARLVKLQPEVAKHLKCICFGPGSASMFLRQALTILGRKIAGVHVEKIEVWCVDDKPDDKTLLATDNEVLAGERENLKLRYFMSFSELRGALSPGSRGPLAHLCIVTGLSGRGDRVNVSTVSSQLPKSGSSVLFSPKTWLKGNSQRKVLLSPPVATDVGRLWYRLTGVFDGADWDHESESIVVPELQTSSKALKDYLLQAHDLSLWVATIDRYASRESLEWALGSDVAILHQESRLGGASPLGLVISQKSGGSTDRAISRSLRLSGIVTDQETADRVGEKLRRVASQGYGILALEAATSGSGINELVAHVVAFSLLGTRASPWPLPPNCRVLLIGLDEYGDWFRGKKRADLLALALDVNARGVHVAAIEVKARRSSDESARGEALEQLRATLLAMRYAASEQTDTLNSHIWLNRIAEAAYSVAREIGFRLSADEIDCLERFRDGSGVMEWAGLGLIFGPDVTEGRQDHSVTLLGDRVPIPMHTIRLTQSVLEVAMASELTKLKTVETAIEYTGGRTKRRPEVGIERRPHHREDSEHEGRPSQSPVTTSENQTLNDTLSAEIIVDPSESTGSRLPKSSDVAQSSEIVQHEDRPLILGWHAGTENPLVWSVHGPEAKLPNGHIEIFGSSGSGKTQFVKALLAQLASTIGATFCITDFKNDYADTFPEEVNAEYYDLWNSGSPYNPLALESTEKRSIERSIIELRDTVATAARAFMSMGHRQQTKFKQILSDAYDSAQREGRWPTLKTIDGLLDDDLAPIMRELTQYELFKQGPPLGSIVGQKNVIFGLSNIPGNGLTSVLSAGFIISALLMKIQSLPTVANSIRYAVVVDEAHRVRDFKAIETMVREGRSKGLATILATQQANDLPEVVANNAQTKLCFRLPDATMAKAAARRLNPADKTLADQIRTLGVGEAFISLGGSEPILTRVIQYWRDYAERL
jgi:hypothetical protein